MSASNRRRSRRRPIRPAIERLDSREFPSLTPAHLVASPVFRQGVLARALQSELTPHETARRKFSATFSGQFVQGQGRLTTQASQIYMSGGGGSSAFLHGDVQLALFLPTDPTQPITGAAALASKNVSTSGSLLMLDLVGDPTSLDRKGRPTRLTWTVGDSSGGTFQGATGSGTAQIRYRPSGASGGRVFGTGGADVLFQGSIDTLGITNVLRPIASVKR